MTGKTCIDAAIIQYLHDKNNTFARINCIFWKFYLAEQKERDFSPGTLALLRVLRKRVNALAPALQREYNKPKSILPHLRLEQGRNLI